MKKNITSGNNKRIRKLEVDLELLEGIVLKSFDFLEKSVETTKDLKVQITQLQENLQVPSFKEDRDLVGYG